jgi:hypothetical protein
MRQFRFALLRACGIFVIGGALLDASLLHAGPERINLTTGTPVGGSGTMVVPVNVILGSGQPDTIDMTYTAIDSSGNDVSCSPSSDRLSVSRQQGATDNVSVTYGGANLPVTLSVQAQGECYGYDTEMTQVQISNFTLDATAKAKADAKTKGKGDAKAKKKAVRRLVAPITVTVSPTRVSYQIVPVTIAPNAGSSSITMTYTAKDAAGTIYPCRPSKEVVSGVAGNPVQHNVFVNTTASSGATITLTVTASDATPADTTTAAYNLGVGNAAAGTGGIFSLSVGPSTSFFRTIMHVTFTLPTMDRIKMIYSAVDGSGNPVNCSPPFATLQTAANAEVLQQDVVVDTDGLAKIKFTAQGVGDTGVPIGPSSKTFSP